MFAFVIEAGVVAPVNVRVTVHARSGEETVFPLGRRAREAMLLVVGPARVADVVAALAELGSLGGKHGIVAASVRRVADHARLGHRRMFERVGASPLRVALEAHFIHRIGNEHILRIEGAHRVMTFGAPNLSLADGVV